MGRRAKKGEVSITNDDGRIRLRWRVNGRRCSINTPFPYSATNLSNAANLAARIQSDLVNNTYDPTMERYKRLVHSNITTPVQPSMGTQPASSTAGTIGEIQPHFKLWVTQIKNADFDRSSYYLYTDKALTRWGSLSLLELPRMMHSENWSPSTYNRRLGLLKEFIDWLVKHKHVDCNPLDDVCRKTGKKGRHAKRIPSTDLDVVNFLEAIRTDRFNPASSRYTHSHYYPYLVCLALTGCRPAEGIGLRVKHIDLINDTILIEEVMARTMKGSHHGARIRKETKTGSTRLLKMTPVLKTLLSRQVLGKQPDDLVFPSPTGLCIDDRMLQRRVIKPVMEKLGMEKKDLYMYRHAFGTRMAKRGTKAIEIAYLMGHSTTETAARNYIHVSHSPVELVDITGIGFN